MPRNTSSRELASIGAVPKQGGVHGAGVPVATRLKQKAPHLVQRDPAEYLSAPREDGNKLSLFAKANSSRPRQALESIIVSRVRWTLRLRPRGVIGPHQTDLVAPIGMRVNVTHHRLTTVLGALSHFHLGPDRENAVARAEQPNAPVRLVENL